jgi:hypothetical protein
MTTHKISPFAATDTQNIVAQIFPHKKFFSENMLTIGAVVQKVENEGMGEFCILGSLLKD